MDEFKRRRSKPLRFLRIPLAEDHPCWPELDRQLPADHLARRIRFLVEQLDLSSVFETYTGVGGPIHPPELMLAFVLFEMQRGRLSPAQWFTDSRESIPARWLLKGLQPSRAVFYRFRDHLPAALLDSLNQQVLLLAQAEGHTTAENASVDGTFTAAYASRHRLLTGKALDQRLQLLDQAIASDVATTQGAAAPPGLAEPMPSGAAEPGPTALPLADALSLPGQSPAQPLPTQAALPQQSPAQPAGPSPGAEQPYWLAGTPAGRLRQRERYQQAQQALQARLLDHDKRQKRKPKDKRCSADKVVIGPMEPEAVLGRDKHKVFRPLYNTQIVQDVDSPLVLGYEVYAQANDTGLLPPMLQRTQQLTGRKVKTVRTDGIYARLKDVRYCKDNAVVLYAPVEHDGRGKRQEQARPQGQQGQVQRAAEKGGSGKKKRLGKEHFKWEEAQQTYRCPQGHLLQLGPIKKKEREQGEHVEVQEYRCDKEHCQKCPLASQCTSRPQKGRTVDRMVGQELLDEVAARMRTEEGKKEYKKRSQTVEPRYADMRTHRGLQRFHGYGRQEARSQVGLLVLAHNGLTLLQLRKQRQASQAAASTVPDPTRQPSQASQSTASTVPDPTRRSPAAIPSARADMEWISWN